MPCCILHADLDCYYASVEMMFNPSLRQIPMAVCGDPELRHGIVLAKNQLAKERNVKTGEALWQARQKCPGLRFVAARMDQYLYFSRRIREMYYEYTDRVEPYGLDECWLDFSQPRMSLEEGVRIADTLRGRVTREFGLTLSIGVSDNRIFAKLGSDLNKPNGTTLIGPEERGSLLYELPVQDLLFIGPATKRKLNLMGVYSIGQLAEFPLDLLEGKFGKNGRLLHDFANGRENGFIFSTTDEDAIKSIGNSITACRDLCTLEDARVVLYGLADCVSGRLRKHGFQCRVVRLFVRDTALATYTRQMKLPLATALTGELAEAAISLLRKEWTPSTRVRCLGVTGADLCDRHAAQQTSLFIDEGRRQKEAEAEKAVDAIRRRFGHEAIRRGILVSDPALGAISPHRICALPNREEAKATQPKE